ncbi:hypothetical protein E2C01_079320 [Portunus trituberculatus]|uniref:Uncharacterized protein n=1 Tax=Portunus trituberculatus TaxID=210409 RepID=A0A5B7IVA5_PORTR|nr:hypothetical protein [Portunus trituberculatus]
MGEQGLLPRVLPKGGGDDPSPVLWPPWRPSVPPDGGRFRPFIHLFLSSAWPLIPPPSICFSFSLFLPRSLAANDLTLFDPM